MNSLIQKIRAPIQNYAIKLYSKIKIIKKENLRKIWKAICKGVEL